MENWAVLIEYLDGDRNWTTGSETQMREAFHNWKKDVKDPEGNVRKIVMMSNVVKDVAIR